MLKYPRHTIGEDLKEEIKMCRNDYTQFPCHVSGDALEEIENSPGLMCPYCYGRQGMDVDGPGRQDETVRGAA